MVLSWYSPLSIKSRAYPAHPPAPPPARGTLNSRHRWMCSCTGPTSIYTLPLCSCAVHACITRSFPGTDWRSYQSTLELTRGNCKSIFLDLMGNTRQKWRFQDVEYKFCIHHVHYCFSQLLRVKARVVSRGPNLLTPQRRRECGEPQIADDVVHVVIRALQVFIHSLYVVVRSIHVLFGPFLVHTPFSGVVN